MNYRLFSSAMALGLVFGVAGTRPSQAQVGNFSDVTGFNLTTSGQIPVGSAVSQGLTYWSSADIQQAVNDAVAYVGGGNYAVREATVSTSGQSVEVYRVAIVNKDGQSETISFTNGDLISTLVGSETENAFEAPSFTPDSDGQVAIAQITSLPDNALNNTIKSFLNTSAASLDYEFVSLATQLALDLQAMQVDGVASPSSVYDAISSFNELIEMANREDKLDQLGDGVYGAYAALNYIVNQVVSARLNDVGYQNKWVHPNNYYSGGQIGTI